MDKLKFAKMVVSGITAYGAGVIITKAIANTVSPDELPLYKKIAVHAGGLVIGAIVKDAVKVKTDKMIDDAIAQYGKVMAKINEAKA